MYADFAEFFRRVLGINLPVLSLLKTFGFMMAMSFLAAGYTIYLEMKRREALGLVKGITRKVLYGKKDENPIQIDVFYYKYYESEGLYSFYMDKLREWWPNEKVAKHELLPLQEVDFKLYLPDGNIMKQTKIKIPRHSMIYLDRAYPNWQNILKNNTPHVEYYNNLFI